MLGAWAIANSTDYAAYNPTNGVGIVGNGGFTGYDATFGSGNITGLETSAPGAADHDADREHDDGCCCDFAATFTNNIAFSQRRRRAESGARRHPAQQ